MKKGVCRRVWRDVCSHWRGRRSLTASFWVNGVGLRLLLTLWTYLLARWLRDSTIEIILVFRATMEVILCALSVWQWVGIWRASGRRKAYWAARLLARACVMASVAHWAAHIISVATNWPSRAPQEQVLVRVLGKNDEAELRGALDRGASEALGALLRAHPSVRTLHITSPGGFTNEGLRIANLVRAQHLRVIVDTSCFSACTLALLASSERLMRPEAMIGFHRPHLAGEKDPIQIDDETVSALEAVGASAKFVWHVLDTSSYDMWTPSQEELLSEHVITGLAKRDQFTYCPAYATTEVARKAFLRDPIFAAMAELNAKRFQSLVDEYMAGPTRGVTLATAAARLSNEQSALLNEASCHPAVGVARDRARQMARAVAANSVRFPDRCSAMLSQSIDLTGLNPEDLGDDYREILKAFVLQSQLMPSPQPTPEELSEARRLRRAKLSADTLATIEAWKRKERVARAALCSATVETYRVTADLEPDVIARLIRTCEAGSQVW